MFQPLIENHQCTLKKPNINIHFMTANVVPLLCRIIIGSKRKPTKAIRARQTKNEGDTAFVTSLISGVCFFEGAFILVRTS